MAPCSRRLLNQSVYSAVASATSARLFQGPLSLDQLGLEQADHGLCQGIVMGVPDGPDRAADPIPG